MNNKEGFQKARDYVFLLLKFRLRSEQELCQRLKKKGFDEEIIKQAISFLKDKGFIDDRIFAQAWIESRMKKPLGLKKIRQELNLKGIDKNIIARQISEIKQGYSEKELVEKLTRERLSKLKGLEPSVARRRVYSYLLRRGFSSEMIVDALN